MSAFATLVARHRGWVLAAATLLGLVAAGGLAPAEGAREASPALRVAGIALPVIPEAAAAPTPEVRIAASENGASKAPAPPVAPEPPAAAAPSDAPPAPVAPGKAKPKRDHKIGIDIDETGGVRVDGIEGTRQYDSFDAFVAQAPWVAAMVFGVTIVVFLTPILIIALVIWYKMRKNRMLNETMIKLAEKGVVPPAEALEAVAGGRVSALREGPSTAPLYEHARAIRKGIAWSDLRKGIFAGAVGLGFVFYSMRDDGSPNGVVLVLLFVGLGYIVLWYFEDRRLAAPASATPPSPPAPPGPPSA